MKWRTRLPSLVLTATLVAAWPYSAPAIDLGAAKEFAVLSTTRQLGIGQNTTVTAVTGEGDVGAWTTASIRSGTTLPDDLIGAAAAGNAFTIGSGATVGGTCITGGGTTIGAAACTGGIAVNPLRLTPASGDAAALAAFLAGLPPTQVLAGIAIAGGGAAVIPDPNPGAAAINVTSIPFIKSSGAGPTITVMGDAGDIAIINVAGALTLGQRGVTVALAGGITPDRVLFNVLSAGAPVTLTNGMFNGTYLAVGRQCVLGANSTLDGSLVCGGPISIGSSSTISFFKLVDIPIPPPPVLTMGTAGAFGLLATASTVSTGRSTAIGGDVGGTSVFVQTASAVTGDVFSNKADPTKQAIFLGSLVTVTGECATQGGFIRKGPGVVCPGGESTIPPNASDDLATAIADANTAAGVAGLFPACPPLGAVGGGAVIPACAAVSVIDATSISGGVITIAAGAADIVILRVAGAFSLSAGGALALAGGITPDRVLLLLTGGGGTVILGNGVTINGTILAVARNFSTGSEVTINGALIAGGTVILQTASVVNLFPFVGAP